MYPKRFFIIVLSSLILVFSLTQGRIAQAEELPQPSTFPFSPVVTDPLYASASGTDGCPDIETDTAQYQFALPVTAELLGEMEATLADGGTAAVEFQTVGGTVTAGQGEAGYSAQVALANQHAGGGRTVLHSETEVMPGDNVSGFVSNEYIVEISAVVVFTDPAAIGDTFLLGGLVEGFANSIGCESGDQAIAGWEMMGSGSYPYDVPVLVLCNNEVVCDSPKKK